VGTDDSDTPLLLSKLQLTLPIKALRTGLLDFPVVQSFQLQSSIMSSTISEEDYGNDFTGYADDTPLHPELTITNADGSIEHERVDFRVLNDIVRRNDTKTLKQYLEKGSWAVPRAPDIPRQCIGDNVDMDYFYAAAFTGSLEALQILLAHKADEDTQRPEKIRFGWRHHELLHTAAKMGHFNVVKFLLDNQPLYADIHERNPDKLTPILAAADFFEMQFRYPLNEEDGISAARNERVMHLLLDYGACANDAVLPGHWENTKTPWETVLSYSVTWAGSTLIKRLIEAGADVRSKTRAAKSDVGRDSQLEDEEFEVEPLFFACSFANLDAVKAIIGSLQASMNSEEISHIRGIHGSLPIHWAARNSLRAGEYVGWLLQKRLPSITGIIDFLLGLDPTTINAKDDDGNSTLHHASLAISRHKGVFAPVITFLCDRGADASIRNNKGQTPLHTFLKVHEAEMHRYTCFEEEFVLDTSAVVTLLAHGARITDTDHDGNTPLHLVSEILNYSNGVSFLLDHGADPSKQNGKQETALHRAARGSCLSRSVLIKAPDRIAAQDTVIGMLVKVGGEGLMDVVDAEGKSPRQLCEEKREYWREQDIPTWKRWQMRSNGSRGGRGGRGG